MKNSLIYRDNICERLRPEWSGSFYLLLFKILLFFLTSSLSGQNTALQFNEPGPEPVRKSMLDEKVMLKTDREIYLCGEKIFFNAFTYERNWFQSVAVSSVLYVELYSKDNKVITRGKFGLNNGKGSGELIIPRSVFSDIYFIRAYTNYMKNFGFQQFWVHRLKIVNPFHDNVDTTDISVKKEILKCQVFSESHLLAEGLKNSIVCRFTDVDGAGVDAEARVMDGQNNIVANFKTYKDGFAGLELTPLADNNYYIEASSGSGKVTARLPGVSKSGLVMALDTLTSENLTFHIYSSGFNNFPLKLIAKHGTFSYPLTGTSINSAGIFTVPGKIIPSGLTTFELIDKSGDTLAERSVFIDPPERFKITLKTDKEKYENREKVAMMIETLDNKDKPVVTDLVMQVSLSDNQFGINDLSSFEYDFKRQELMQLDINEYDLIDDAVSDSKLLNLILFAASVNDNHMRSEESMTYLPETDCDIISGRVVNANNTSLPGIKLIQSFTGKGAHPGSAVTDKNGNFRLKVETDENRGDLIIKVQNTDMETSVLMDDEFYPGFAPPQKEFFHLTKNDIDLTARLFINIQVDDAYSPGNNKIADSIDHEVAPFYGKNYTEYNFSKYVKLPNMKEFIFEIIEGVVSARENNQETINIIDNISYKKIGPNPLMMIDGVPVYESAVILALNPENVRYIRVVRNKYFYKMHIFDGILDIITLKGDATSFKLPKNTFRFNFMHTEKATVTDTQQPNNVQDRIPVYRNLLYINPDVKTDINGKATVTFYLPDNNGTFNVECFGFTNQGLAGEGRSVIVMGAK